MSRCTRRPNRYKKFKEFMAYAIDNLESTMSRERKSNPSQYRAITIQRLVDNFNGKHGTDYYYCD